jgi:hypothetical protein
MHPAADSRTCTSSQVAPEEIRAVSLSVNDSTWRWLSSEAHRGCPQFKTSLVARRFPGIKALSDEEIATLVLSERKSRGETRTLPQKTYPKTQFRPMSPRRDDPEATQAPPKFIPCNPSQAKATIVMPPVQASPLLYMYSTGPMKGVSAKCGTARPAPRRVAAHPVACIPRIFAHWHQACLLCSAFS